MHLHTAGKRTHKPPQPPAQLHRNDRYKHDGQGAAHADGDGSAHVLMYVHYVCAHTDCRSLSGLCISHSLASVHVHFVACGALSSMGVWSKRKHRQMVPICCLNNTVRLSSLDARRAPARTVADVAPASFCHNALRGLVELLDALQLMISRVCALTREA